MTLTLSALVLLLLALPGVVTVYAYNGRLLVPGGKGITGDPRWQASLLWAVVVSVLLHLLLAGILTKTRLPDPDFFVIVQLISGYAGNDSSYSLALQNVAENVRVIFSYFATLYILSWYAGVYGRKLVAHYGLDLRYPLLRVSNEWHYLFRGADQPDLPALTVISATVELCEVPYLYIGLLSDYQFDSGGLRYVTLVGAKRRKLENDRQFDDNQEAEGKSIVASKRFYPLEGEYLVLYCSSVKTLNIDYIYLERPEGGSTNSEGAALAS